MRVGLDIGSTTIKCVVLDDYNEIVFSSYHRHFSQIVSATIALLRQIQTEIIGDNPCTIMLSGSAGMGMADATDIPFTQEVYATKKAADYYQQGTDVIIELGGEDAKILFLKGTMEVRMNGSCAGGTGSFIDQMATLLNITVEEMNELAKRYTQRYTIASRCGVFAKTDIQPLLNQGVKKEDIAISIFDAVVNQTIAGLAQGRPIKGKVLYLGGPLTFLSELRNCFDTTLQLEGVCPENSLYYVAVGAAISTNETCDLNQIITRLENYQGNNKFTFSKPLFENETDYQLFIERHNQDKVKRNDINTYQGNVYLGIDAGSTTIKTVVIDEDGAILDESYQSNSGNPVPIIKKFLENFYQNYPDLKICAAASTGYGEDIIKNAFSLDYGVVETVAHFEAAKTFKPDVDFVIDIGGQDMKCFKVHHDVIDNIFLNEACSSGCGSFLQTFALALGEDIASFAKKGLFADKPVDLGSRCTVFMNSSVKQAQKDGASVENISAGLSISVVKNAIYKVIRPSSIEQLGKHIVVQGGTFYNDAVLRAFEIEMNCDVVRPDIAGLMGAYGAALYAKNSGLYSSSILNSSQLQNFTHEVSQARCGLCENHCLLTINTFDSGRKLISGNRCERPVTNKAKIETLNMYEVKRNLLSAYQPVPGPRGKIGIPYGLNMYELLPFWHAFFTTLGFELIHSPYSNRAMYLQGQSSIPSDTVCFPAKLMHGHVEELLKMGIDTIFYPCMSYNIDDHITDNTYNCPVVAYYPEVLQANMESVRDITFIMDYIGIHRRKDFSKKMTTILQKYYPDINNKDVKQASDNAYAEYDTFMNQVKTRGLAMIQDAREKKMPIIVLAGRPYHIDPEISHGIDQLIAGFGVAVLSEDVLSQTVNEKVKVSVLNQWTYHGRLYASCKAICDQKDMNLVQLVSFGCGCDAITTDECREMLESADRIYTQIKIDEITNLGAVKIRLRSLLAAIAMESQHE